jgi:ribosomal protein S18 acetylase RimI-like enzyme
MAKLDAFLVVADDDKAIIGMALGIQANADDGAGPPIAGLCHVSAVFVASQRWGQGIGRHLVEALLDHARLRGYSAAQLWTHADNQRAQRLYEGMGFRRSSREHDDQGEVIVQYQRSNLK